MRGALSALAASSVVAGGVTLALTTPPLSGGTLLGGGLVVAGGVTLARLDLGPARPARRGAATGRWFAPASGGYSGRGPDGEAIEQPGQPPKTPATAAGVRALHARNAKEMAASFEPGVRMVHGPFRLDLLVLAERVRETTDEAWPLVDDVDDLRHSADPEGDDAEALRTVAEHLRTAWASLAAASTALQEMTKP